MRKALFLLSILFPLFASAQSLPPTGITPYTFNVVWNYMKNNGSEPLQLAKAEQILTKAGYHKVGKFIQGEPQFYYLVYAKACNLKVSKVGQVLSAFPNDEPGFSSYIKVGPGIGFDWDMSVTFLSKNGANTFIELLKKSNYIYYSTYEPGWVRLSDECYFYQNDKTFSVSEVPGIGEILGD